MSAISTFFSQLVNEKRKIKIIVSFICVIVGRIGFIVNIFTAKIKPVILQLRGINTGNPESDLN